MYRRFDEYDRSGITGPVEDPPGGGDPLPARILGQKWLDITWAWDPSASLAQLITGFEVGVAVGTAPGQDPWLVAPFTVPASDRRAVRAVSLASDLTTAHACVRPLYGAQAGPWTVQGVAQSVAAVPVPVATLVQVQAAQTAANGAATAAANAQAAANAANAALADIAADGKLTPSEKQSARLQWDTILGERAGIQSRADAVGVSRTTYDSAFQTLATYLNAGTTWSSGTPSWLADANLSTTTPIDGPTFRANWKSLFDARQALLNAITAAAQTAANTAQTAANNAASAAAYADALARSSFNLIKNGNSEDANPSGPEAVSVSTGGAYTGTKCRVITSSGSFTWGIITPKIQCAPGDQFVFEAQACGDNSTSQTAIAIEFHDAAWNWVGSDHSDIVTGTGWHRHTVSLTAPANAASVDFIIGSGGPAGTTSRFDCLYAARKVSAGMLEADILKAMLVKGEVIESPNYVPGSAGVAPVGFRQAGAPFTVTYLDGSTGSANLELGEGASIAGHSALSYANMLLYRKVEFASPGAWSWTVPAGVRRVRITACGPGGGGQGGSELIGGSGGRNGAALVLDITSLTPGQVISGVNGPGGAGGMVDATGTDGSASTLTVAGKTWTINGGAGGGKSTTTVSTLTGGYSTSCTASERKNDPLDGWLLGGLNIQSMRYPTGANGAKNDASDTSSGGYGSWLAPGGKGGDGGTTARPDGQFGADGTKGSGGGGGGGSKSGRFGGGGGGGNGGPGYVLIEY